jgi:hypothetical protein
MSTQITVVNDIVEVNVTEEVIVIEAPSGAYPLPTGVFSVFGRTGNVVSQDGDYNLTELGDVTITNPSTGQVLRFNGTTWENSTESYVGTVTSVAMTTPTGLTVTGSPITTAGTLAVGLQSGYSIPTDANQANWTSAYNDKINSATVTGTSTRTLTLNQQDGGTVTASWTDSDATNLITEVYNQTGATLTKGTIVYINGSHGNLPAVAKALATSDATSAQTYGVVRDDITNMNNGYVIVIGNLENMDTQAYADGTQLYLSGTTAGTWTSTKPHAPIHLVYVGIVVRSHPTQGVVEIKIQNGYELDELHDVLITTPTNGNILQYDGSTSLWKNVAGTTTNIAEGTNLYYTDARSRAAFSETVTGLDYNSSTGILSTTTGYGIPTTAKQTNWDNAYNDTIVSAAVTGTTTKTLTLTQQDAGTITASWSDLQPVTSVFGRTGAVVATSGDYTTTQVTEGTNLYFTNARARAAISLTVSGNSGSSTYSSTTGILNVPTYTLSGLGGEPAITAGTTAQYWRGDKSWQTLNTTAVVEGTNLYYTQARFDTAFSNKTTTNLTEGTNLYYTQTRFDSAFAAKSTTDLAEGSNLYFTTARAQGAISGTSPISVTSGVVSISQANSTTNGYLSSTDWNTFNNKQAAGNYITALTGEVTASGPGSASATLSNSAVIGKVLTGLNITGGTIAATDSILDAFGKVQNQINGLIGGTIYKGTWNASTNTPTLTSSVGTKGWYYIVSVPGTTNLNGITDWQLGDWAIYDGTAWQKVDNTDAVVSVNGYTGAVSLTTSDISEGTNQYFTTTRARASVSAGTGISYNSTTGVITNSAPDQTVTLTGGTAISTSGTYPSFTITNTAPDQVVSLTGAGTTSISGTYPSFTITSNDQYQGTVTSVAASVPTGFAITGSPITNTGTLAISYAAGYALPTTASQANWDAAYAARITTANAPLSIASNAISISQANGTTDGYLSSTDWTTFNAKQSALTFGNLTSTDITVTGGTGSVIGSGSTLTLATVNSNVGSFGSSTAIPVVTVNGKGLVTAVSTVAVSIPSGSLSFVGDVTGSGSTGSNTTLTLATVNTNVGTYGNSTTVPTVTVNGKGLVTAVSQTAIPTASGTTTGLLSSTDWTTFNNKQGAITLTTTGSSGASTFSAGTLNIPNYTLSGLGGVPTTRTLSINGTTYDLSADRSWTITPNVNATNTQDFTATAGQTAFTVTGGYTVGQLAVYYNGSKLAAAEYTATNGTSFTLATACQANDIVQAVVAVTGGGIGGSGTTNYHAKWTASGVLGNGIIYDDGTNIGIGFTGAASKLSINGATNQASLLTYTPSTARQGFFNTYYSNAEGLFPQYLDIVSYGQPDGTNGGGIIRFLTNPVTNASAAVERMRISSTGQVSIGTTSAVGALTIKELGLSGAPIVRYIGNAGNGEFMRTSWFSSTGSELAFLNVDGTSAMNFGTNSSTPLLLYTAGTERINIASDGVTRFKFASDRGIRMKGAQSSYSEIAGYQVFTENIRELRLTGSTLQFYSGDGSNSTGAERARITEGGNLLFNNTTNSSAFAVQITGLSSSSGGQLFLNNRSGGSYSEIGFYDNFTYKAQIYWQASNSNWYLMNGTGGVYMSTNATSWTSNSDERLKDISGNIENAIDKLMTLRAINFSWKSDVDKKENLGLIAQDVEKVFPQVIDKSTLGKSEDQTEYLGVRYQELVPVLIKAIQEQQTQIEELKQLVATK